MKKSFLLLLICYGITGFSQNFGKMQLNLEYEVTMYSFTKKMNDDYCYSAVGGTQMKLVPRTLDSDIRLKLRKDFRNKHFRENAIKVEHDYVYVKKNDWVVIVEHHLSSSYCKDQKKLQMFKFPKDKEVTDELIDKKVKSSVTYLWNEKGNYQGYKVLQKFQPYNNETNERSLLDLVRKLILDPMSKEEKSKFLKKYDAACMCVRG